ncbi:MAG: hypothetical protein Q8L37_02555 [Candidatus Gottesmanbacteria bacterium]|nr:hypothetical protein [Candidatus Gottesmanbacteria bacterium]
MNRFLVLFSGVALLSAGVVGWNVIRPRSQPDTPTVLGTSAVSGQTHFDALSIPTEKKIQSPTPSPIFLSPTSSIQVPLVTVIDGPGDLIEGDMASFTWYVDVMPTTIRTTTIYYGTTSDPGVLVTQAAPDQTQYTRALQDFMDGTYGVPLRFVGSIPINAPGTYYYRGYARIGEKHYWSSERSFVVTSKPKHDIKVSNFPAIVISGENAAFTWDIYGPAATSGFTAIVGGKTSKPRKLEKTVDLPQTPYTSLTQDFNSGSFVVPLRFIGNAKITDPGVYYFRALAFINGKNIWSDEYSFIVK